MEVDEKILLAPDHKMPYCCNKGFFITAVNIDYDYIRIRMLLWKLTHIFLNGARERDQFVICTVCCECFKTGDRLKCLKNVLIILTHTCLHFLLHF